MEEITLSVEYFKYQLLDKNNTPIRWIDCVESGHYQYASLSRLKQSATLNVINLDIGDINNRIRIYHIRDGVETMLATLLVSNPESNKIYDIREQVLECFSTLWLLSTNKCKDNYFVQAGTDVLREVERILNTNNLTNNIPYEYFTSARDKEWKMGTPYLDICNDLLESINYTSLYPMPDGSVASRKYVVPKEREIEFIYDEQDEDNEIEVDNTDSLDYFDIPNIFIRYIDDPISPLVAEYVNDNPDSPTSIVKRPPNPNVEEVMETVSLEVLTATCKRAASEATDKFNHIVFKSSINPRHSYLNCVFINLNKSTGKCIETSHSFDLETGASMIHEVRRSIAI